MKILNSQKYSLNEIIREEDFIPLVQEASLEFFKIYNLILKNNNLALSKKFYSHLMGAADLLESFLDNHGARENKTWFLFTELIASIRNISVAAFHVKHNLERYGDYNLEAIRGETKDFIQEINYTLDFFNQTITILFKEVAQQAKGLGLIISQDSLTLEEMRDIITNKRLPLSIEEEEVLNKEERILEVVRRFRKVNKLFHAQNLGKIYELSELNNVVPTKLNENKLRKIRGTLHGVQSEYDTYIKNTNIENRELRQFRGHISLCLHLLVAALLLLHFYERHESGVRQSKMKEKITTLIDKNKILDRAINFSLYYCNIYLQKGNKLAEGILSKYARTEKYELPVPEPLGFHARPATYVSLIVNEHGTDVFLLVEGKRFNAKSVLNLMEAGGILAEKGLKKVIYEGDKRALDDIKILSEYNYCENCEIPPELNYLRILRNM